MSMTRANFFPLALSLELCLVAYLAAAITNITTDQSALFALKSQLHLDSSHILSRNWSYSTSVCGWTGVSCGLRHQRVTGLDVSGMGLAGSLPPEMGNLSFLVSLNLSSNSFNNSMPQQLAQLRRLKVLDFSFNNFTGDFPPWLELLAELKFLNLRNNSLTGFIPNSIANISKLETLDLSYNSLHGNIPAELGKASSLKMLILQYNEFTGIIPVEVFNMSNLETLAFTGNSLSGELPADACNGLPKLKELYLSRNEFNGLIPSNISKCSKLHTLWLSYNKFTGPIPKEIGSLRDLELLYLGANDLRGEIPEELGNLKNLKELGMGVNFLTGSIPASIFNISSLRYLSIASCNLTGAIPSEMCSRSSQLEELYLSQNEIVGQLPAQIGECSALQILLLSDNNITGVIPRGIGNLTNLQMLYVGYNNLIGTVPEEIGNLYNLEVLYLAVNSLSGSFPGQIFNISTLQLISVSENQLSGNLPSDFGYRLPDLQELYINGNNFNGEIPESISNSSQLTILNFDSNRLSGLIPRSIGELRYLQRLDLSANEFTSETAELSFISSLTNCRNLEVLGLGGIPFNGTLPVSIGNFSSSLQYLYVYESGLVGSIPDEIGNLTHLILLSLHGNQLTGSIPNTLVNLLELQGLALFRNKISGALPRALCELPNLNGLDLHQNQITGTIPDCIGKLTSLRTLYLMNNKLVSGIPTSLWQLNDLLELNLSSNVLTGFLPPDIGNLKAATIVDLSMNKFSGIIPIAVGDLQNLNNLSLAHNRFTGSIPESFGKLLNLEILNLSHNNLSGTTPNSLEALRYLTYFDVSVNDLSGQIPSGGSFKNFNSQLFMSNEGLCGDPRYGVPLCRQTATGGSKRRRVILRVVYAFVGISVLVTAMALAFVHVRYRRKEAVERREDTASGTTPLRVSYYDIVHATEGFSSSHLIGAGGFSSVYEGTLQNGEHVAIKVFNLQLEGAFKSFDAECEALRSLRHRNLCKITGACSNESFKALIIEYMPNGSLDRWIHSEECFLNIKQRISIMIDVACALEYLHHGYSVPVAHCDLKPGNVLLDEDMVARLSDFGIAKLLTDGDSIAQTKTLATMGYMAPEYGSEGLVSRKCDVYSYGIMLMEVFTGKKPSSESFSGDLSLRRLVYDSLPNGIMQILDSRLLRDDERHLSENSECLSSIMDLALNCSMERPNERINMKDVVVVLKKAFEIYTRLSGPRRLHEQGAKKDQATA